MTLNFVAKTTDLNLLMQYSALKPKGGLEN